jgi:hypothetical protein
LLRSSRAIHYRGIPETKRSKKYLRSSLIRRSFEGDPQEFLIKRVPYGGVPEEFLIKEFPK